MASTVIGSTSATFGLSDEGGIIVNSFSKTAQSSKAEVMNADGDIEAVAYYGKTATISVSGVVNGGTGIAAAEIGATLTVANETGVGGISSGSIYVDSVSLEGSNDGFQSITVEATQYPDV